MDIRYEIENRSPLASLAGCVVIILFVAAVMALDISGNAIWNHLTNLLALAVVAVVAHKWSTQHHLKTTQVLKRRIASALIVVVLFCAAVYFVFQQNQLYNVFTTFVVLAYLLHLAAAYLDNKSA